MSIRGLDRLPPGKFDRERDRLPDVRVVVDHENPLRLSRARFRAKHHCCTMRISPRSVAIRCARCQGESEPERRAATDRGVHPDLTPEAGDQLAAELGHFELVVGVVDQRLRCPPGEGKATGDEPGVVDLEAVAGRRTTEGRGHEVGDPERGVDDSDECGSAF